MDRRWIVWIAIVVSSGCLGKGSSASATPSSPTEASTGPSTGPSASSLPPPAPAGALEQRSIRHFENSFPLTITGAKSSVQTTQVNLDNNCVNFGKGTVWLVFNGTAAATWSSSTPLDQKLALELWDGGGQGLLYKNDGSPSPSVLPFQQFRITQATTLGFAFIVQPMPDTVVVKVPVTLEIAFDYLGLPETGAHASSCNPQPRSV